MTDDNIISLSDQDFKFEPIVIRYDGIDAEKHTIDLHDFGKSCQGISKAMATVAHYITTGNYNRHSKKLSCRVIATTSRENCYSFSGIIEMIDTSPLLVTTIGGLAVALGIGLAKAFSLFFKYIWLSCAKKPMTKEAFEKEIKSLSSCPNELQQETINKLVSTLDSMCEGLIAALKDSVKPIGHSCDTLRFGNEKKEYFLTIDLEDKAAINGEEFDFTDEQSHRVLISEYDMQKATCKVSLIDDIRRRFPASIVDPQAEKPKNPYSTAMNEQKIVTVRAKQRLYKTVVKESRLSPLHTYNNPTYNV